MAITDTFYNWASRQSNPIGGGKVIGGIGAAIDTIGNVAGNRVRDFGVSENLERLGGMLVSPAYASEGTPGQVLGYDNDPRNNRSNANQSVDTSWYTNPGGSQTSSNGSGGVSNAGGGIDTGSGVSGPLDPSQSPGGGQPSFLDVINNEYNSLSSDWDNYENQANQDLTNLKATAATDKAADISAAGQQRDTMNAGIRDQRRLGLAEARQMLHDLSVRDNAQLAASGGGVNKEALADRFSRAANSSLGNIQNEANRQMETVNQFYADKVNNLDRLYRDKVSEAEQRKNQILLQIASDRTQAKSEKVRQSYQAWADFYNSKRQMEAEAYSMKLQYDAWKEGKLKEVNDSVLQLDGLDYNSFIDQAGEEAMYGMAGVAGQVAGGANPYNLPVGARYLNMKNQGEDEELLTDNFLQNAVLAG